MAIERLRQSGVVVSCPDCAATFDAATIEGAHSIQTVTTLEGHGVRVFDTDGNVLRETWHCKHNGRW